MLFIHIDIDLGTESPVGHGKVICASIYSGPDVDFGNGPRVRDEFGLPSSQRESNFMARSG